MYLEPFVRSFLLGVGSGVLMEGLHVLAGLAQRHGGALMDALPAVGPPLVFADTAAGA